MHDIADDVFDAPDRLTPAVLQIADMLGMYRAELARVLHLQCGDIGRIATIKETLTPGTQTWQQAVLFVRFYRALYAAMDGDEVAMVHWLRADNKALQGVPLLLMVDEDRVANVLDYVTHRL